ncbi:MAG: DEAD/DEAH box helicase [Opitutales bacterium]|nr:DEAD/DEAH box helicase [Opitutales bacterium]
MSGKNFKDLGLAGEMLKALELAGYESPTPIQQKAIPEILAGFDIFGCAQTGTGKTAAFMLPIIQKIHETFGFVESGQFRALILAPTRELVEQIAETSAKYAKFTDVKICKIYGGVSQNRQIAELEKGVDILVATPGRLLDLFRQKKLSFAGVEFLVLDEADRMLDMGFIGDIRAICSRLPGDRISMLFSATLSREVEGLASSIVRNPKRISISPESPTVEKIDQRVCFVEPENKISLLKYLIENKFRREPDSLALVFCRTKHGANKVANRLAGKAFNAAAIHSDKSQSSRKNALERFKNRESRVLVATDIAARGIDVKAMSLVINYDLPEDAETYVHRIGRTARAEASGEAVSLCSSSEVPLLRAVEKYIRKPIARADDNPFHSQEAQELMDSNKKLVYKRPSKDAKKSAETAKAGGFDKDGYGSAEEFNKNAVKKFIKPRKNGEKKAPEKEKAKTHFTGKAPLPHSTKKFKPKGRIAWAFSREKRSGKGGRK